MFVFGSRRQHRHAHAGGGRGHRQARPAGRRRSASDHLGGRSRNARTALICCRSRPASRPTGSRAASNRSLQWGEQIVKPIFEAEGRPRDHVSARQEAWLRRSDVQEHQGRGQLPVGRGHSARDQPRQLVHRLLGQSPGAPEVAHGATRRTSTCARRRPRRVRTRATITVCRGRAGARRSSSIPARRSSTTPNLAVMEAAARSARASASSARKRPTADPQGQPARKATIRRTRRSRTAIPSSPRRAQEARLGQGPHRQPSWR